MDFENIMSEIFISFERESQINHIVNIRNYTIFSKEIVIFSFEILDFREIYWSTWCKRHGFNFHMT